MNETAFCEDLLSISDSMTKAETQLETPLNGKEEHSKLSESMNMVENKDEWIVLEIQQFDDLP